MGRDGGAEGEGPVKSRNLPRKTGVLETPRRIYSRQRQGKKKKRGKVPISSAYRAFLFLMHPGRSAPSEQLTFAPSWCCSPLWLLSGEKGLGRFVLWIPPT